MALLLPRLSALLLLLLLLLLLPRDSVSRPEGWSVSVACRADRVDLRVRDGELRVLVNGEEAEDAGVICEAVKCPFGGSRLDWGSVDSVLRGVQDLCRPQPKPVKLSRRARKLLLFAPNAPATVSEEQGGEEKNEEFIFRVQHPNISVAIPGMFLLCCGFLCPCFRAKRKDPSEQHVLSNELSRAEASVASEKGSSTHSKVLPATPRAPPSPLFVLSPPLNRVGSLHLSVNQIIKATHNFSPSLKVGEGGVGTVYKAVLPNGQIVAVKRAKKEHFSALRDEFSNEIELLAKIEHRNLVKFLGYIDKGNERIIITEFVPNGTLREHLDGQYGKILDFHQRLEIAIDVAHGLTYLHLYAEKVIIHRDVKSSNILLTESYRAKVSDFGFARAGPTTEQTHIMTKVKGTAGYLDPEYLKTYQLTPKSDVFSFGILLIEILSGRRPVDLKRHPDERITIRWAFHKFIEGNSGEILDPCLNVVVDGELLGKVLSIAFQCAAPTRSDRPTMKEVVEQLWEIRKDYGRSCNKV